MKLKITIYIQIMLSVLLVLNNSEAYALVNPNDKSTDEIKQIQNLGNCIFLKENTIKNKTLIDLSGGMKKKHTQKSIDLGFNPAYRLFNARTYNNKQLDELLRLANVKAMRFPGGTYANFFDWDTETLDEGAIIASNKKSMLNSVKGQKKRNAGRLIRVSFDRFMSLAQRYKIKPYVTLNVYTRGVEYNISLIDKIKKKWATKIYWELGNELLHPEYEYSWLSKNKWNRETYYKKSEKILTYIKRKYPGDEVGIIGGALLNERRIQGDVSARISNKNKKWNEGVIQNSKFDAVIFHPYVNLYDKAKWQAKRVEQLNSKCETRSKEMKKAALEYRWVFGQSQEVPKIYQALAISKFPNKKIWATEVGLIGGGHSQLLDWRFGVPRTLFNLHNTINWLDYSDNAEVLMFHLLGKGQGSMHSIYRNGTLNANSISYNFIKEVLDGAKGIAISQFVTRDKLFGLGKNNKVIVNTLQVLSADTEKGKKILIVNVGNNAETVKFQQDGLCARYFGGSPFISVSPNQYRDITDFPLTKVRDLKWAIPAYTVALLETCH